MQQHAIISALQLLGEEFADARAVRDKPTLAELGALDDEQAAGAVDVTDTQRARLTDTQSQPIAEREDRAIGRSAEGGLRVIRERGGCIEQPARSGDSKRNGIRVAVSRRRRVCSGEASSNSCATAQSSSRRTTPNR